MFLGMKYEAVGDALCGASRVADMETLSKTLH